MRICALALILVAGCGPRIVTTRATRPPGDPTPAAFFARLTGPAGVLECESATGHLCSIAIGDHEPAVHRLRLERGAEVIEGDLALRGSEVSVSFDWYGATPSVGRYQRAPASVTLELATLDPHREWEGYLPIVLVTNGSTVTFRGTSIHGILHGTLHRSDEWGRWEQVGGGIGCGTVIGPTHLRPGVRIETDAPDYLGPRPPILADARYRFSLVLALDEGPDLAAIGVGPLVAADSFPSFDFVALELDLTGAEILAAQGQSGS